MSRVYGYKKEYIEKVEEYLTSRKDEEVNSKVKVKLPTIEGFANFLGVARKSLYNWEKNHPKFALALEKIRAEQLERLIDKGLEGTYNSTIAKLILSANHDMREKSDVTSDDEPLNIFTDEQADRIADRIARRKGRAGNTSSKK